MAKADWLNEAIWKHNAEVLGSAAAHARRRTKGVAVRGQAMALEVRRATGVPYDVVGVMDGGDGCLVYGQTHDGRVWLTREIGGDEFAASWVVVEEVAAALLKAAQADGLAAAVR